MHEVWSKIPIGCGIGDEYVNVEIIDYTNGRTRVNCPKRTNDKLCLDDGGKCVFQGQPTNKNSTL